MRKLVGLAACVVLALVVIAVATWSGKSAESSRATPIGPASAPLEPTSTSPSAPLVVEPEPQTAARPEPVERAPDVQAPPAPSASTRVVLVRDAVTKLPIAGATIDTRAGQHAITASDGTARVE